MITRKTVLASLAAIALPALAFAQSDADLRNAAKTPDRILTYGMSYSHQRFSTRGCNAYDSRRQMRCRGCRRPPLSAGAPRG